MKRLKTIAFTLLLVVALGIAPATLAQDETSPLSGVLTALTEWLQAILEPSADPASSDIAPPPEQNQAGIVTIVGG